MTKDLLEDYPHICYRISELEQMSKESVTDTVSGSSASYPYTKHAIRVEGRRQLPPPRKAELEGLLEKKRGIEAWVDNLDTERAKGVVRCHALKGLGWKAVCRELGFRSPDAARVYYERTLKNNL